MPVIPSPRTKHRTRLEIIPFIDIMFFLLATFMMTSLSMIKNEGITVQLPQAKTGQTHAQHQAIDVTITENGIIFYKKEPLNKDHLMEKFKKIKSDWPNPIIIIHGDQKTAFKEIVFVLDSARKSGITQISIETTGATQ